MKIIFTYTALCLLFLMPFNINGQGCLDAAIYFGTGTNTMNAFRGDDFISMQWSENVFSSPSGISSSFSGLNDWSYVDAAFEPNNGTFALIKGPEIAIFDKSNNTSLQQIALTGLYNFLPANFQEGIDAAFAWPGGGNTQQVFFFKGKEWLQFNWDHDTNIVSLGSGPNLGGWDGVLDTYFTEGIDAALFHDETLKVYFFSGNQYIRYDGVTGVIDAGYPLVFNEPQNWGNYPAQWSCIDEVLSGDCNIEYQIPDFACSDGSEVEVLISNTPGNTLGTDVGIESVSIFIEHTYIGDMTVSLVSPSGQEVLLVDQVGGDGDNFGVNCGSPTTFVDGATNSINTGTAPFQGIYRPVDPFTELYDSSDPNGVWTLRMCDNANQDVGVLQAVEIIFFTITDVETIEDRSNEIQIYPNPNNGDFTLEWASENEDAQIVIRDIVGRIVYQSTVDTDRQTIDLGTASKGTYLVQIQTADRNISKKMMVQ